MVRRDGLHTVCEEAGCPNIFECWRTARPPSSSAASSAPGAATSARSTPASLPPWTGTSRVGSRESVATMGLRYATVTGVARDDLPTAGPGCTPRRPARSTPTTRGPASSCSCRTSTGSPHLVDEVIASRPEVGPQPETVPGSSAGSGPATTTAARRRRQGPCRRPGDQVQPHFLGMGEEEHEIEQALRDLHAAGHRYRHHHPVPAPLDAAPSDRRGSTRRSSSTGPTSPASPAGGSWPVRLVRSSHRAGRLWAQAMASVGREIPAHLAHLAVAAQSPRGRRPGRSCSPGSAPAPRRASRDPYPERHGTGDSAPDATPSPRRGRIAQIVQGLQGLQDGRPAIGWWTLGAFPRCHARRSPLSAW